uniref:Family with sequence similarity 13 member A n=1 Tax=Xenopus tropicalis TaxID=8364 RepID=A0A6I8RW70_XENTR
MWMDCSCSTCTSALRDIGVNQTQKSKAAIRLKEDMKKVVSRPARGQPPIQCKKVFGVQLKDLHVNGLVTEGIPTLVWNIVEYLRTIGMDQEGLFRVNGNVKMVEQLKLKYESGEQPILGEEMDVHSAASLLKLFLREMPDGVITTALLPKFIEGYQSRGSDTQRESSLKDLLKQLPDSHYSLLKYLCHFLTQVVEHCGENRMNVHNLATVFGPSCFHVSPGPECMMQQNICNKIMERLLEDYTKFFECEAIKKAQLPEETARIITVKEYNPDQHFHPLCIEEKETLSRSPHIKKYTVDQTNSPECLETREVPYHSPQAKENTMNAVVEPTYRGFDKPKVASPRRKEDIQNEMPKEAKNGEFDKPTISPRTKKFVVDEIAKETKNWGFDKPTAPGTKEIVAVSPVRPTTYEENEATGSSPRTKLYKPKTKTLIQEFSVLTPKTSDGTPQPSLHVKPRIDFSEDMDLLDSLCFVNSSTDSLHSSQDDERPMSPFYVSGHVAQVNVPADRELLERTIRTAVEQHLFDVLGGGTQSSEESESGTSSPSTSSSARQRRRHLKEQDEIRKKPRDMEIINKENIPSGCGSFDACGLAQEAEKLQETCSGYTEERSKPKRQKSSSKLSELNENQDSPLSAENFVTSRSVDIQELTGMEVLAEASKEMDSDQEYSRISPPAKMKIQEQKNNSESRPQRRLEAEESFVPEVPRLDLTSLCDDNNWEEPVPALTSWEQDGRDSDEARLSPQAGRLIRQLLEADSDPMLSPRFYAYGHSQQYLDDPEVPPSPPNAHSFMRRRSSSLGSHEEDRDEDLTPAQLTRKIQSLKKKIRKFEDKFEEDRKYRPSHRDKATNPEVLKWMNELAKFRKQLKETKIKLSEDDLVPQMRQRSNTLPKSFGSQLDREEEKKPETVEKPAKPSMEATMEAIQKKLQEKRNEVNRPEDIKDMTRDQIAAEKVSLQKALLYYESIHGRPVTKNERQVMKPLYDRYRLFKQILSRANTIPVIEEEEGSEDDTNGNTDFTVTMKPGFSVRTFLEQLDDDADGFVSPVDDNIPSKSSQDLGLGNLHSASIPELLEQLQEAREEKKRIRKVLRDFEDNFLKQNGRNVQKEDRNPMAEDYIEYKHVKAKIRLLEVLINKRGVSQTM